MPARVNKLETVLRDFIDLLEKMGKDGVDPKKRLAKFNIFKELCLRLGNSGMVNFDDVINIAKHTMGYAISHNSENIKEIYRIFMEAAQFNKSFYGEDIDKDHAFYREALLKAIISNAPISAMNLLNDEIYPNILGC